MERRVTEKLFKLVDEDGSGFVDFGEFISSARSLSRQVAAHEKALNPEADAAVYPPVYFASVTLSPATLFLSLVLIHPGAMRRCLLVPTY